MYNFVQIKKKCSKQNNRIENVFIEMDVQFHDSKDVLEIVNLTSENKPCGRLMINYTKNGELPELKKNWR